jgi:hypothetical protein
MVLQRDDPARAAQLLAESLGEHQRMGDRWFAGFALLGAAGVLAAMAEPERAAGLLPAVLELTGNPSPPPKLIEGAYEHVVSRIRLRLSSHRFENSMAATRGLSTEWAIENALSAMR